MENIKNSRILRVTEFMKAQHLDAILVMNCYLGNWNTWLTGSERMPLHLPYNRNNVCFITPDGEVKQLCARAYHPTDWFKFPLLENTKLPDTLKNGRLGLVNPSYLKKTVLDHLVVTYPGIQFVDVDTEFHQLKMEKTEEEITRIENAAALFDRVFTTLPLLMTNEPTERDLVVALRDRMREMNAECEDLRSSTMVTLTSAPDGGPAVPEPIPYPGRRITYGDRVNVLVNGFMPGGFASALGRTYILGEPTAEARAYWDLAVKAQSLLAEKAVPGTTVASLMEILEAEILVPNKLTLSNSMQVYGIGAAIQEMPRNVDCSAMYPLKEGMTLVIAPKICPEGKDPYCCMDTFVVTKDGAKRLSTTTQALCVLD